MRSKFLIALFLAFISMLSPIQAQQVEDSSFLPIWQLLNREQKEQFVAGYLRGMKDASKMTDVLAMLVKDNPNTANDSLQHLKGLFGNLSQSTPDGLTQAIDRFYANPKNKEAPLSRAVTGAHSKM